jgi:hypothetical protein
MQRNEGLRSETLLWDVGAVQVVSGVLSSTKFGNHEQDGNWKKAIWDVIMRKLFQDFLLENRRFDQWVR